MMQYLVLNPNALRLLTIGPYLPRMTLYLIKLSKLKNEKHDRS